MVDAVWEAVKYLIPVPVDDHPLGCHRPRISDRICFEAVSTRELKLEVKLRKGYSGGILKWTVPERK